MSDIQAPAVDSGAMHEIARRVPRTGVPFLEAFRVEAGPPGLLGRFFLSADQRLRERGLKLQFITFDELSAVRQKNLENWGSVNPMFDREISDIPSGSLCLVGIDAQGEIRACGCAKPIDATQQSLAAVFNAGKFLALKQGLDGDRLEANIDAPTARKMFGVVGYIGGIWVHPDARGGRLASIFTNLISGCILTLWTPTYVTGTFMQAIDGTALQKRYNLAHIEPSVTISRSGEVVARLNFGWMSSTEAIESLRRYLDTIWPQIDAAVVARRQQHRA